MNVPKETTIPPETPGWQIRLFQDEDKPSFLELAQLHFKDKDVGSEAYLDWLRKGGPAGPAIIPVAITDANEIIGFSFQVPFEVKHGDAYEICRMGCNALVHPNYRVFGVYAALQKLAAKTIIESGSIFGYGFPKPGAIIPHQKAGRFPVSKLPLLIRPLDIDKLTTTRLKKPVLRWGVSLGWKIARNFLWRPKRGKPIAGNPIQISQETRFDERFDHFWQRVENKYDIIIKRDRHFLNWRFCDVNFRQYTILSAQYEGKLIGYIVLRATEIEQISTGLIMDFLVEPGAKGENAGYLLVEAALRHFQEKGLSLAGCFMLAHTHEFQILRRAGLIEPPERFTPQAFNLFAITYSPKAPKEDLAQADRWFITMANHDAV